MDCEDCQHHQSWVEVPESGTTCQVLKKEWSRLFSGPSGSILKRNRLEAEMSRQRESGCFFCVVFLESIIKGSL